MRFRARSRIMGLVGGLLVAATMAGCTPHQNVAVIEMYASNYGVNATTMLGIASCESNFIDSAYNPSGASGLFQFMPSTYNWARNAYFGGYNPPGSIMNPGFNASTAAAVMHYYGLSPWNGDPYLVSGRFCVGVP